MLLASHQAIREIGQVVGGLGAYIVPPVGGVGDAEVLLSYVSCLCFKFFFVCGFFFMGFFFGMW